MLILILILAILFVVIPGIRVVNQYERGVVQRLGRFRRIMEPGLHVIIPYIDAKKAVFETTNYAYATSTFAQTALRDVTGNFDLDELLSKRDKISSQIKEIVDTQTDKWGIDIENVKLQNIELPSDMKRAMAKQAEAERERRAAIISAEGEKASAAAVAEAANLLAQTPGGLNIRTLQTLEKISTDPSQKTVILLPSDLAGGLKNLFK